MAQHTRSCSRKRTALWLEKEAKVQEREINKAKANWAEVLGELTLVCHFAWHQKQSRFRYNRSMKFSQLMIDAAKLFKEIPDDSGYTGYAKLDHVILEKTVREHMENWQFNTSSTNNNKK